jgi:hypothetical protein
VQSSPGSGLFLHPGAYAGWEQAVHLVSEVAILAGALAVVIWAVGRLTGGRPGPVRMAAYASLALALAASMISLAVVGTAPLLTLSDAGVAEAVAARLAVEVAPAKPQISVPPWALGTAQDLLNHLNAFQQGRYRPTLPSGYRIALVDAIPESSLAPMLSHGNLAPLGAIGHEVDQFLDGVIATSAVSQAAQARQVAVGAAHGVGVTYDHRIPTLLVAVMVR